MEPFVIVIPDNAFDEQYAGRQERQNWAVKGTRRLPFDLYENGTKLNHRGARIICSVQKTSECIRELPEPTEHGVTR